MKIIIERGDGSIEECNAETFSIGQIRLGYSSDNTYNIKSVQNIQTIKIELQNQRGLERCPTCNKPLIYTEGCRKCIECNVMFCSTS